jgi:drug/metabolite transporter (DMT)-like permease
MVVKSETRSSPMRNVEPHLIPDRHDIRPIMVLSVILSLFLLIVVLFGYAEHPREVGKSWSYGKGTSILQVGYTIAVAVSAFAGLLFGKRWIGCLHATLMVGVSVYFVVNGLSTLMGGRGSDANPFASVVYGAAVGVLGFGVACGIFTFALWAKALRSGPRRRVYPLQR